MNKTVKYFVYDFNQVQVFNIGFETFQQAFDYCLGHFKTDEEMNEIIILPFVGRKKWLSF